MDEEQLTPAQRVGIDGVKVRAVVGRYNAIRLTATEVNLLAGAAGIRCTWKRPPVTAEKKLLKERLVTWKPASGWRVTERGEAWLRAEGLID